MDMRCHITIGDTEQGADLWGIVIPADCSLTPKLETKIYLIWKNYKLAEMWVPPCQ